MEILGLHGPPARAQRRLFYAIVLLACTAAPALFEWRATPPPAERQIHIEHFRYGSSPSIIRANRGDDLRLTFSTRDTGHSFFLQDYRLEAKIPPASEFVEVIDPLDLDQPPEDVREVRLEAGMPGVFGRLVSSSRFRCHVYCGPMHGFEQGDLIVRPNWLLAGGLGLLFGIVMVGLLRIRWEEPVPAPARPPIDLARRVPTLGRLLRWRPLQFAGTLPTLAVLVVLLVAGFFGTKMAGRNSAVLVTWVVWMALLSLILVPVLGRLWCMVCPLPALGEYVQRGATTQVRTGGTGKLRNRFFGWSRPWPRRLRSPWVQNVMFLALGTFGATLAGQPRWTASALLLMTVLALAMSLVWEGRAFCRYVCPAAAFIKLYSSTGRLQVRSRDQEVCRQCKDKDCLRGNAAGWACPYGLCVQTIDRNADCGMCTECFKSCQNDNVALSWRRDGWTTSFRSYGEAWQAVMMLFLAVVYSITVHSPFPFMRDITNLIDKASWWEFGIYVICLWSLALVVVPSLFWLAVRLGLHLAAANAGARVMSAQTQVTQSVGAAAAVEGRRPHQSGMSVGDVFKRTMPAVIPMGLSLWMAFFISTLMINIVFIVLSISDPFGWGWDLFGTAGQPWVQIWPAGIPWIQCGLLLAGLVFSLRKGYQLWFDATGRKDLALRGFSPTAAMLVGVAAGMLIYFSYF